MIPVMAQDSSNSNPPGSEATQSFVVPVTEAEATVEAIATQPVTAVDTPAAQPPLVVVESNNFAVVVLLISNVISYGIILLQAIMQNGSVNRKTIDALFGGLKGLAKITPGDADDRLVAGAEAGANALLGGRIEPAPAS